MLGFSAASRKIQNQQWVDRWSRHQILGGHPRRGSHSQSTSPGDWEPGDKGFSDLCEGVWASPRHRTQKIGMKLDNSSKTTAFKNKTGFSSFWRERKKEGQLTYSVLGMSQVILQFQIAHTCHTANKMQGDSLDFLFFGAWASASVLPLNIHGWFPWGLTGLMSLLSKGLFLKSLLQDHNLKASLLVCSILFMVQLSNPYMTTGKTITLTIWTFAGKVMSILSRLVITFLLRSKCL